MAPTTIQIATTEQTAALNPRHLKLDSRALEDRIDFDRIILRNSLRRYIQQAWHVVEPSTTYLENWHIDLIAEYLEAVTAGEIKRPLINMPPRYAKSTCVSIMWPTWVWARERATAFKEPYNQVLEGPGTRWIFASYADELRTKHSLDRRKMLQSEWYRARWPRPAELTSDQNVKTLFTNSSTGQMFATTMTGAGTGLVHPVDRPQKPTLHEESIRLPKVVAPLAIRCPAHLPGSHCICSHWRHCT